MDLLIAFILLISSIIFCLAKGYPIYLGLLAGFVGFYIVALRHGQSSNIICKKCFHKLKESMLVVKILLLVGIITASWRTSGTIAFFLYYGIKVIHPSLFIFIAFVLSFILSYALGSTFGTAGTLGVILMAICRSGGVNPAIAAGAVMSGIYLSDRCSPSSSCAHLLAAVTHTDLYSNLRTLFRHSAIPVALCCIIYIALSVTNPLCTSDSQILDQILQDFHIPWYTIIPAVILVVLPLMQFPIKAVMVLSVISALVITVTVQNMSAADALMSCVMGFQPQTSSLNHILDGGGLVSMVSICLIILISSTYSAIFDGTDILDGIYSIINASVKKIGKFPTVVLSGIIFAAVFCNQSIAVIMNSDFMTHSYDDTPEGRHEKAMDIGNSTVTLSGLVPWSIACSVPLNMMGVGVEALPYSFFLYFITIYYFFMKNKLTAHKKICRQV